MKFSPLHSYLCRKSLRRKSSFRKISLLTILLGAFTLNANADEVDVIDVTIESLGGGKFLVNATLLHADTGWDHYANRWDVLNENGDVIGVRELAHPHVNEQPFTRSLRLSIAEAVKTITVRANDSVDKLGGKTIDIAVPHP